MARARQEAAQRIPASHGLSGRGEVTIHDPGGQLGGADDHDRDRTHVSAPPGELDELRRRGEEIGIARDRGERRRRPGTALRDERARASSIAVLFQRVLEETKRLQYTT